MPAGAMRDTAYTLTLYGLHGQDLSTAYWILAARRLSGELKNDDHQNDDHQNSDDGADQSPVHGFLLSSVWYEFTT